MEFHTTWPASEVAEIGLAAAGSARPSRGIGGRIGELLFQIVGELVHQRRGGRLDHADAAAVLRDRARQREVGVHQHLGAGGGGLEPERGGGLGRAAALGVGALGLHARGVIGVVDLLELHEAREGQRHRARAAPRCCPCRSCRRPLR